MTGRIHQWPSWPEFGVENSLSSDRYSVSEPNQTYNDKYYQEAKKAVITEYGPENLKEAWIRVCKQLESVTNEIISQGTGIIPVCSADAVEKGFSLEELARIKKTGCVVVREVIPKEEARAIYKEIHNYIKDNRDVICSWPADAPYMFEVYDSPMQNAIRSNPRHLKLQRLLNNVWHYNTTEGDTSSDPLIFYDGVRDRPPGQYFLGLGPHIDAGSLARWSGPKYRKVYEAIFSGHPEDYDAWDLEIRKEAEQDFYKAPPHTRVLRSFQGWTALTSSGRREGCILLYPNIKSSIAYVLLRPFFRPPKDEADIMNASKWTFDDSDSTHFFPGSDIEQSQRLSRSSHPHLRLEECLVHVPQIDPGDTVWWHTDLCHAVDPEQTGAEHASVAFIPSCPTTSVNKVYVKKQLEDTLAGRQPEDMQGKVNEQLFKGYQKHTVLSEEARRAFGYYF
ncbi:hypothetical protein H072_14 [Dactylellina haptotyla CBS 200.50]|uniref:DUF1479 domain protein n=1 Tax=Dactylellina haptotyla (strain CBS 200.50) TaxID=1284197 RepID=S8C2R0_DACHA|nr:hypothetical protein H072_14 [Dactylellina haptotyla CBS 200.50]